MTHASLFSGIGGFDLAAEWMGWENAFHCEINPFCQTILKYYWPNATTYTDITTTDFTIWRGKIDILTGGFPCQPYSTAGKRLGKEDARHLWPEMLRAIREIEPTYIVGENVFGLVNWNGGLVFNEVQVDLETQGYEVQPVVLPACAVGAPHRRDRVWFVAYSDERSKRSPRTGGSLESNGGENHDEQGGRGQQAQQHFGCRNVSRVAANAKFERQQEQGKPERSLYKASNGTWKASWAYHDGRWPTQSPVCSRDDGISARLDGITFSKWRQESLKGYGNAIVPQVEHEIFKAIITAGSTAQTERTPCP